MEIKWGLIIAVEIVFFLIIVVFGVYFYNSYVHKGNGNVNAAVVPKVAASSSGVANTAAKQTTTTSVASAPDYSKLIINLPKNPMIQDLPSGKSLYFQTFSFSNGERVWEKSFIIEKGTMSEGKLDNPEVTLTLHSKYVNQITASDLCDVLRTANKNKDFGFESSLDYVTLAWRYSSLMKYKSCFS